MKIPQGHGSAWLGGPSEHSSRRGLAARGETPKASWARVLLDDFFVWQGLGCS